MEAPNAQEEGGGERKLRCFDVRDGRRRSVSEGNWKKLGRMWGVFQMSFKFYVEVPEEEEVVEELPQMPEDEEELSSFQ